VLLYAHKFARSSRCRLNLAWVYFNSGHAAEAKALFQSVSVSIPISPAPAAWACWPVARRHAPNDHVRKSLSKSYSGVVAAGYTQAQQVEEKQQQQQKSTSLRLFSAQRQRRFQSASRSGATTDPQETLGNIPAFQQAMTTPTGDTGATAAAGRGQPVMPSSHSQIDPDGTINLPRVFDKQLLNTADREAHIGANYGLDETVRGHRRHATRAKDRDQ